MKVLLIVLYKACKSKGRMPKIKRNVFSYRFNELKFQLFLTNEGGGLFLDRCIMFVGTLIFGNWHTPFLSTGPGTIFVIITCQHTTIQYLGACVYIRPFNFSIALNVEKKRIFEPSIPNVFCIFIWYYGTI